jgi:bifunctional non-homologous end joining protein LigD
MQYEFSLRTKADKAPAGSDWIHEIKHDGYRMLVIREQERMEAVGCEPSRATKTSLSGWQLAQQMGLLSSGLK